MISLIICSVQECVLESYVLKKIIQPLFRTCYNAWESKRKNWSRILFFQASDPFPFLLSIPFSLFCFTFSPLLFLFSFKNGRCNIEEGTRSSNYYYYWMRWLHFSIQLIQLKMFDLKNDCPVPWREESIKEHTPKRDIHNEMIKILWRITKRMFNKRF